MDRYAKQTYGDTWAASYDELFAPPEAEVLSFLESLAGGGPVLELAIGTGRVALPLSERGLPVHGVEISPRMLELLRSKPGGADIPIVGTDMTDFVVNEPYPLILLAFNTLFSVQDPGEQAAVFRCVASALIGGGSFVVEAFVPDLGRFDRGQTVRTREVSIARVVVEYSIHHPEKQAVESIVEVRHADGSVDLLPVPIRYLFPDQIDSLAEKADLVLAERLQWYDGTPFTDESTTHVSVYRKEGGAR